MKCTNLKSSTLVSMFLTDLFLGKPSLYQVIQLCQKVPCVPSRSVHDPNNSLVKL